MHELAVTQGLINMAKDTITRYHATKLTQMNIVMGELSTYIPECVQEYFALLAEETPAAECKLVFRTVKAKAHCNDCGHEFRPGPVNYACPNCKSLNTEIIEGKELYIENMEIETDED